MTLRSSRELAVANRYTLLLCEVKSLQDMYQEAAVGIHKLVRCWITPHRWRGSADLLQRDLWYVRRRSPCREVGPIKLSVEGYVPTI